MCWTYVNTFWSTTTSTHAAELKLSSISISLFFFSADFHDNLSKLLEQLFTLYPSKFVGERVRVRQTDDDGDAQTSATGADQKEEYGWTHSFSVVPEVSLESSDIVVQEEGDA